MADRGPLIGVIAGEQSGQVLAADLIDALERRIDGPVRLTGLGGARLADKGLESLFDPEEIALIGIGAVIMRLPRLIRRIGQTADALIAARPDCLVLVDSPDFSLRVARRVKAALPDLPVIKYVAPTVWAWRPGRAAAMARFVDHVLAVLPFEPEVMASLGGPKTHYVGHRLMADDDLTACWQARQSGRVEDEGFTGTRLLVLPGSRRSEVKALLDRFAQCASLLAERGADLRVDIPTLPRLERTVRDHALGWSMPVRVTTGRAEQIAAFRRADAAICASGTITLELALAGVPAMSCYVVDPIARMVAPYLLTTWSAALPNIIADRPIIREYYNEQLVTGALARQLEDMIDPERGARATMMDGYAQVRREMAVEGAPSDNAARIVADVLTARG